MGLKSPSTTPVPEYSPPTGVAPVSGKDGSLSQTVISAGQDGLSGSGFTTILNPQLAMQTH